MKKPKIGAVSYLNTVPLIHALGRIAPEFEIELDLPSRLADRLAAGELDAALIPVVEALAADTYTIVSDACIACNGPVWSVKLLSRVPVEKIQSVALDEGSRTSIALVKILMQFKYDLSPEFEVLPVDADFRQVRTDSALVIGDRAMNSTESDFEFQFDLGKCWNDWTQMPFVFAVWAAAPGADLDRLSQAFSESRDIGLAQAPLLADKYARNYGLTPADCLRYFTDFLSFRLGETERTAIQLFSDRASQVELLPEGCELKYHDCPVA